jgi:hypothetical protein
LECPFLGYDAHLSGFSLAVSAFVMLNGCGPVLTLHKSEGEAGPIQQKPGDRPAVQLAGPIGLRAL